MKMLGKGSDSATATTKNRQQYVNDFYVNRQQIKYCMIQLDESVSGTESNIILKITI